MKKSLKIAIICGGLLTVSLIGGGIYYVLNNSSKPSDVLNKYVSLLNDKDYEGMYSLISSDSNISKEDFVKRNKNIYEGIGASDINVTISDTKKTISEATINYDSTLNSIAGEINFSNSLELKKDNGKDFKIVWNSKAIFPELQDDYKVIPTTSKGKRGSILDRNGASLAMDGKAADIGLVPGKITNKEDAVNKIASILQIPAKDINDKLNASYVKSDTFVELKVISKDDSRKQSLLQIPGVKINDKDSRIYPFGAQASHLTGYVHNINADELEENKGKNYNDNSIIGASGLEKIYEDKLRSNDGAEINILDNKGNKVSTVASKKAEDGKDIKVTIDSNLQSTMYADIANDKGAAVAMNPNTGEVLALISTPSYDPNDFVLGISQDKWNSLNNDPKKPMYNRFKSTAAPGSTFKPITGVIGLDTKTLDPNQDKNISGLSWQKDSSWGSYSVTRVHEYSGGSNLQNALVYSDNIYFAQAALDIGKDKFIDKIKSFGFDEDVPFDFGLTKSQYSSDGKIDKDVQLADSGYGQAEMLVNPVHLASMYSMFVNNGSMVKPTLLYQDKPTGEMWKSNVVSKEAASTILNDMVQVVENPNGTGHAAQIPGVTIAGKTGTAEIKASQDDKTGTEIGWFGAITTNKTNNVLVIEMVEDVKDRGSSGYVVPKVKNALLTAK
ncbi:penicillin-binding transpeptidase domain-containing protein [Clostridium sp. SHJSY1]|uniref:penicillin-binding transpeptidase domain-containing protein n=1 Tax=Clostridium sp. SHJSY1 TaxID=2942483 RepID=UPI0028740929|nr:penicillin-binding transpeptidase domain-containing protein [Clostridium sp. SHJSY1]MDS0524320.1 penicillin-binding transpeptidase domain-containing protein [Clostridium sp. SHJSY1]